MITSLYTGATGMKGLGSGMNVVSTNIANANTIGYKAQDALFSDLMYSQQANIGDYWGAQQDSYVALGQLGHGVQLDTVRTQFRQGAMESSNTVTDMGINGKGYFQVEDAKGEQYYTRAGDFRPDKNGVLRTPAGMALMGYGFTEDGAKTELQPVIIDKFAEMPAKATSSFTLLLNVSQKIDHSRDPNNPYFSLLQQYDANATPPLSKSVYGYKQDITLYDANGAAHTAAVYFDGAPSNAPGSIVEYLMASEADDAGGVAAAVMSGTLRFDSAGQLTGMSAYTPATTGSTNLADWPAATLSPEGVPLANINGAPVSINMGIQATGGWQNGPATAAAVGADENALANMGTAFTKIPGATTNYTSASPVLHDKSQDGYPQGTLNTVNIGENGMVTGRFSNNQSMNLWQIPLCRFTSDDGLHREGNNLFSATPATGTKTLGEAGTENFGTIHAYNIETSNVDMAAEMVDMIVTQRGFQSNSKVVTTADQMLQKAMELKRS